MSDGTSWAVVYLGSAQTTSQSTPSGTTIRGTSQTGTTSIGIICDSNAGISSWAQHSSTAGSAAVGAGGSVELKASAATSPVGKDIMNGNNNFGAIVMQAINRASTY